MRHHQRFHRPQLTGGPNQQLRCLWIREVTRHQLHLDAQRAALLGHQLRVVGCALQPDPVVVRLPVAEHKLPTVLRQPNSEPRSDRPTTPYPGHNRHTRLAHPATLSELGTQPALSWDSEVITMPDRLIQNVDDAGLRRFGALAQRLGISRSELLQRETKKLEALGIPPASRDDLDLANQLFGDALDDDIMARAW